MKSTNWKNLFLVGMIITGSMVSTDLLAGNEPSAIAGNRYLNSKEYQDMKVSMGKIKADKAKITDLKTQLKAAKYSNKLAQKQQTRKTLRKTKAELKLHKRYLRIDKRDLQVNQFKAIQLANKKKRHAKIALWKAKQQLRRDLRKGNSLEIANDTRKVEELEYQKKLQVVQSTELKEDVYEFYVYLENEIDQVV